MRRRQGRAVVQPVAYHQDPRALAPPRLDELAALLAAQPAPRGPRPPLAPADLKAATEALVRAVRYDRGARGFSPSTRAAGYGAPDAGAYRASADAASSVWCQIEDAEALDRLDAICAVGDVDCLFVGRADLAASLGVERQDDPAVARAVEAVAAAGRRHARATGIFIGAPAEIPALRALGYSVFVCGADQGWLKAEGLRIRRAADAAF